MTPRARRWLDEKIRHFHSCPSCKNEDTTIRREGGNIAKVRYCHCCGAWWHYGGGKASMGEKDVLDWYIDHGDVWVLERLGLLG